MALAPALTASLAGFLAGCSSTLDLGSNDAGIPYDADCAPGSYSGTYECVVSSGATVPLSASGSITVVLVPAGAHTLALAPDAATALSGRLDCSTRALSGKAGPVAFSSSTFNGTVTGAGSLTAAYDADASPPALVGGVLDPPAALDSTCTWSAHLAGP
jgi:hypothetical protein